MSKTINWNLFENYFIRYSKNCPFASKHTFILVIIALRTFNNIAGVMDLHAV
jgi:hypothetical protein